MRSLTYLVTVSLDDRVTLTPKQFHDMLEDSLQFWVHNLPFLPDEKTCGVSVKVGEHPTRTNS